MANLRIISLISILIWASDSSLFATGGPDDGRVVPSLDFYLSHLPGKNIAQVVKNGTELGKDEVVDEDKLLADFAGGPSPKLVAEIDKLLAKARANYSGPTDCNLLQDLRDVAAGKASPGATLDYVKWRLKHQDLSQANPDDITPILELAPFETKAYWKYLQGAIFYKAKHDAKSAEDCFNEILGGSESTKMEAALFMKARCELSRAAGMEVDEKDPPAQLKAAETTFQNYIKKYPEGRFKNDALGWQGGVAYRNGDSATALGFYIEQIDDPEHPENVDGAAHMIQKCLIAGPSADPQLVDTVAHHPAVALALTYFTINDGWDATSKDYFDDQFNIPQGGNTYDDASAKALKARTAAVQSIRKRILPALADRVLVHKILYGNEAGLGRYFSILAHAASDQGDQEKALKVVDMAGDQVNQSDDLAFVKALILSRMGKRDLAINAYKDFLVMFPKSPLFQGAQFRYALALHDNKQDGDALLELAKMNRNIIPLGRPTDTPPDASGDTDADAYSDAFSDQDPDRSTDPSVIADYAVQQTMDTIMNFAPIDSLAAILPASPNDGFRTDLRQVLIQRCLSAENYTKAADLTDSASDKQRYLTQADEAIQAKAKSGHEAAALCAKIADFWTTDDAATLLSKPMTDEENICGHFLDKQMELQRRVNGNILNFQNVDKELESRFPASHWQTWSQFAYDAAPNGALAPHSLWSILESQRVLARSSPPFTQAAAVSSDVAAQSRKTYDLLISHFPDSPEAQGKAAFWTMPISSDFSQDFAEVDAFFQRTIIFPGLTDNDIFRGNRPFEDNLDSALIEAPIDPKAPSGEPYSHQPSNPDPAVDELTTEVKAVPSTTANMDSVQFTKAIQDLKVKARSTIKLMDDIWILTYLEDLDELAKVPNLDVTVRNAYVTARWDEGVPYAEYTDSGNQVPPIDIFNKRMSAFSSLIANPKAAAIQDFIDCHTLYVINSVEVTLPFPNLDQQPEYKDYTFPTRDYEKLAQKSAEFLIKYPTSPKREAAYICQLRGLLQLGYPTQDVHLYPKYSPWTGQPTEILIPGKFDQVAFDAALQNYNREFPRGQYRRSALAIQGRAAILESRWDDALDDLLSLKKDLGTYPEFTNQVNADICAIFNRLEDYNVRASILEAILKRPEARNLLAKFVSSDLGGIPYLRDFLLLKIKNAGSK